MKKLLIVLLILMAGMVNAFTQNQVDGFTDQQIRNNITFTDVSYAVNDKSILFTLTIQTLNKIKENDYQLVEEPRVVPFSKVWVRNCLSQNTKPNCLLEMREMIVQRSVSFKRFEFTKVKQYQSNNNSIAENDLTGLVNHGELN